MSDIDLFYEIKNLFNTSDRAFNIFNLLKYTTQKSENNEILYIVLNLRTKDEIIRKYETFTDFKRISENILKSKKYKDKTIEIRTIQDVARTNFLYGKRYGEIRFYQ
ncbi:MAG: hypothetical protein HFJ59_03970 [Clostridia bacterium]|nr:hypothetical protein [Clostridia bacterium]